MSEYVTKLLNNKLEFLDHEIVWVRNRLSNLAISTENAGKELDKLTAERRALADHLEVIS